MQSLVRQSTSADGGHRPVAINQPAVFTCLEKTSLGNARSGSHRIVNVPGSCAVFGKMV